MLQTKRFMYLLHHVFEWREDVCFGRVWRNSWTGRPVKLRSGGVEDVFKINQAKCSVGKKQRNLTVILVRSCVIFSIQFNDWKCSLYNRSHVQCCCCRWRFLFYLTAFWYGVVILYDVSFIITSQTVVTSPCCCDIVVTCILSSF